MMKPSLFVTTPDFPEVNYAHLYRDTVDQNAARAKSLGFEAIELLVTDPDKLDVSLLKKSLEINKIDLACFNTGPLWSMWGFTLINEDKKIMKAAMQKLKKCIDIAAEMHCFVGIGLFRGKCIPDKPIRYSKDLLVDKLKEAAEYALKKETGLSIEPTNRFEINFINTTTEGLEIIDRVGADNLGLTLDLYHIFLEDNNIYESITKAKNVLKHMHFSDSDRWPAGFFHGEIDFDALIRILYAINYDGYLSEGLVDSSKNPDDDARKTSSYLKKLIQQHGY